MAQQRVGEKSAGTARAGRLDGQVAFVTGSDSGIGRATVLAFAREGAKVVVTYRSDEEGAREVLDEVQSEGGAGMVVRLDHTKSADVARVFREIVAEFGAPTLLVNNAGVNALGKKVWEMADEDFDHVIRTNLHGPFYCTREFVRHLDKLNEGAASAARKGGVIINVTSVHEEIPMPGATAYNAAKGGLRQLTRTVALELAEKGIRVNNLAPGMILTPMNQEAVDDRQEREKREQNIPVKRAGRPEEVAAAAVFLASEESSYMTGSTLVVDGGLMINMGQGA